MFDSHSPDKRIVVLALRCHYLVDPSATRHRLLAVCWKTLFSSDISVLQSIWAWNCGRVSVIERLIVACLCFRFQLSDPRQQFGIRMRL